MLMDTDSFRESKHEFGCGVDLHKDLIIIEEDEDDDEQGMMKMDRKKSMNIESDFNIIENAIIGVLVYHWVNLDLIPYMYIYI